VKASKIGQLLWRYQEYPDRSVGKQEEEFLIAVLEKSRIFLSGNE
jgi:hypothetical protein